MKRQDTNKDNMHHRPLYTQTQTTQIHSHKLHTQTNTHINTAKYIYVPQMANLFVTHKQQSEKKGAWDDHKSRKHPTDS